VISLCFTLYNDCDFVLSCEMTYHDDLALADRQVLRAEGRITRQLQYITDMTAYGQNPRPAEDILQTMKLTLKAMQAHRHLIAAEQPMPAVQAAAEPPERAMEVEERLPHRYPGLDRRLTGSQAG
jgi:hypothetical protein